MIEVTELRSKLDSAAVRSLVDQLEYPPAMRERKTAQILADYRENPSQLVLGAGVDGELLGFIGLRPVPPDRAVIQHIAVRRDRRGQGIGRQMILHVCSAYRLEEITAETDCGAVGFYRRVGFSVESLGKKHRGTERFLCRLARTAQRPAERGAESHASTEALCGLNHGPARLLETSLGLVSLREEFLSFFQETESDLVYLGDVELAKTDLAQYLGIEEGHSVGKYLEPGWVPQTRFWYILPNSRIAGTVALRHGLTPQLRVIGGNIGYIVRPSERRKGYATAMLGEVLPAARRVGLTRVLVTTNKLNVASRRVIERNGGIYSDESYDPAEGRITVRYWIDL